MKEKVYKTDLGDIHYFINDIKNDRKSLIFLPGLTANHRLFDKQIEYFKDKYNVFVLDAPGHAKSYPFKLNFSLMNKARWLNEIIKLEKINDIIIVGQSMGGYVGQTYSELFPNELIGFVSIDSAPLKKKFMSNIEIWLLKHTKSIYKLYPCKMLVKQGSESVADSLYGKKLMYDMMMEYDNDRNRYINLTSHGMKMLAEAVELNLSYSLMCPSLLICGENDKAGSAKRYNKLWHNDTKIPIVWIKDAGHNCNTDKPEEVNELINKIVKRVK